MPAAASASFVERNSFVDGDIIEQCRRHKIQWNGAPVRIGRSEPYAIQLADHRAVAQSANRYMLIIRDGNTGYF